MASVSHHDGISSNLNIPILPSRDSSELSYIHGSRKVAVILVTFLIVSGYVAFFSDTEILFVYSLSFLPGFLYVTLFASIYRNAISPYLALELFFIGGAGAFFLSLFWESQFKLINKTISMKDDPSLYISGIIVFIGFVEEIGKFIPIAFLKVSRDALPYSNISYRVVESRIAMILAGVFVAAGCGSIENTLYCVKAFLYLGMPGAFATIISRSIVSLPIHMALTGYSAAILSKYKFMDNCDFNWTSDDQSVFIRPNRESLWIVGMRYFSIICIPALNHGLFDASLLAMKATAPSYFNVYFIIAMTCYVSSIVMFILQFYKAHYPSNASLEHI